MGYLTSYLLIFLLLLAGCLPENSDHNLNYAKNFSEHIKVVYKNKKINLPRQIQDQINTQNKEEKIIQCMMTYIKRNYQSKLPENYTFPKPPHNYLYDNFGEAGYYQLHQSIKKYGINNIDSSRLEIYNFYENFLSEAFDSCYEEK